jgi:hypothetical protein
VVLAPPTSKTSSPAFSAALAAKNCACATSTEASVSASCVRPAAQAASMVSAARSTVASAA